MSEISKDPVCISIGLHLLVCRGRRISSPRVWWACEVFDAVKIPSQRRRCQLRVFFDQPHPCRRLLLPHSHISHPPLHWLPNRRGKE